MSLDISEFFDKTGESEWLSAALKSLKLSKLSDLEKKLNYKTCEGVTLHSNYGPQSKSIELNSFPRNRKLIRISNTIVQAELGEGLDAFYGTVKSEHPSYTQILEEKGESGANCIIDILALYTSFKKNKEQLVEYISNLSAPKILVKSSHIHNAGGSIVQEISFILSILKFVKEKNLTHDPILIEVALDSLYFNNISKLRAIRFLGESLQEQCGLGEFEIMSTNSKREQTLYDPWMNMLRNTASTAAAFIGGADQISVSSYDAIAEDFSEYTSSSIGTRQSRNIFHILNEESFLSTVEDTGAGSYAIESLTAEYIQLSFEKFKLMEKNGGVLGALTKFSHEVETVAMERKNRVAKVKTSIAGVNNFTNTEERLHEIYKTNIDMGTGKAELFPIRRTTQEFEQLRQSLEGKKLEMKILAYGPENKLSGRLMFCTNYFETLGYKCDLVKVDKDSDITNTKASGIVLCSTDDLYAEWLAQKNLDVDIPCFIAGNKYKVDGIQNIFLGQNVLELLESNFGGRS